MSEQSQFQETEIPLLVLPSKDSFRGYIKEEDIEDLTKRDKKTLLKISILEQINDHQDQILIQIHVLMRTLQRQQMLDRLAVGRWKAESEKWRAESEKMKADQMKSEWHWALLRWIAACVTAAAAAGLFRWLFGK